MTPVADNGWISVDMMGNAWFEELPPHAERMSQPVRCTFCSGIYDLHAVTVTVRHADCSLWRTPCCDKLADDREWKSRPDYHRLPRPEERRRRG